jgi:hypothetical protein
MFRRSRNLSFLPHGARRSRWPAWLWLVLGGLAAGAAAVILVQQRYLVPQAEADRVRLVAELGQAQQQLDAAHVASTGLTNQLAAARARAERLQGDLASVVDALPPDPRNGAVEVRMARFTTDAGMLVYDLVLTRDRAAGAPLPGQLKLIVAGATAQRSDTAVTLEPIALSLGRHEVVRGRQPLPEGFVPRETTVQVLDRAAGRTLGTRVGVVR